jgi:plasmid stabilization system protein ParE
MTETTESYRGYVLVARAADLGARCWAWKDQTAVHKMVGSTVEEAILAARSAIDAKLGTAQREGTQAAAAYVQALEAILPRLTEPQRRMLQAHYYAPDRTMTASQLAHAAGYASYSGANLQYGILGKAILEQHPMEVRKRFDGTPIYTFALADAPQRESAQTGDVDGAEWNWQMLPTLAHALRVLGIVADT